MNKSSNGLRLQSYKIDTSMLLQKEKELNEMKSELSTVISNFRNNEQSMNEQNQRLKEQIAILQKKLGERVDHNLCNQKIKIIESKLAEQKKETIRYKQMYEIERKNHNQLNKFYEKKMDLWKQDNNKLVEKYQQRISSLASQISVVKTNTQIQIAPSKKTFKSYEGEHQYIAQQSNDDESLTENQKAEAAYQYNTSIKNNNKQKQSSQQEFPSNKRREYNSKTYNMIPPKSPTIAAIKNQEHTYGTGYDLDIIAEQRKQTPDWRNKAHTSIQTNEEAFERSIRKFYFQLKEMGISPKDALMLPQMKKMASNKSPSRKDLLNFLKNAPVSEDDSEMVEKNINYLEEAIREKYGRISGNFVTELMIEKVEEYQAAEKINSEEISVSGLTPSLNRADSFGMSSVSQSAASKRNYDYVPSPYKKKERPSIAEALKIESDNSIYKY